MEQQIDHSHRVLLVGPCLSKDVGARLKRAGYQIVRVPTPSAGIAAAGVFRFDFVLIDADGAPRDEIAGLALACRERRLRAMILIPPPADDREPTYQLPGQFLEKPVGFDAVVAAIAAAS